ncbi:fungal-specific transcription factor domain-containing protein [Truncatella angustata]|uniref:Fungal-specific transcription factor domain-containing protein n=1 Tax=Truncatella angustata TaxID=152316 RepID=A0A9P8REE5_9PEZI|nr:fungal-specific transcription factor domain-containing protein [Truncatella angustata]KAH6638609.1 fungal-specific transcription factor domain-containing protein [Truncatella angustata]
MALVHLDSRRKSNSRKFRLSWPDANDARRAVVAKLLFTSYSEPVGYIADPHFVHVSSGDLERHYHLPASVRPILQIPLEWNPLHLKVGDAELFQYFQCTASQSLAIFPHDSRDLGNVLVRIALTSNTKSGRAVLQSLLAFASIHRHNVHSQAVELKLSALKALACITGSHVGTEEAIQHVAAGMLLCSFETHQTSCTSGQWTCYVDGVKDVIRASCLEAKASQDGDLTILLAWVNYHDVLKRFVRAHWPRQTPPDSPSACAEVSLHGRYRESSLTDSYASPTPSPGLGTIELLSEVCDALAARPSTMAPTESLDEYRSFLKILDWKIRNIEVTATADDGVNSLLMMEVYKLAVAVYLSRASNNMLNQAARTQVQVERGFSILGQMSFCARQFPVFILGCEARRDDQRVTVLDLMSRTEEHVSSRSFNYVKAVLQAIWAQEDLANGEIKFGDKIRHVFGCCSDLPAFV